MLLDPKLLSKLNRLSLVARHVRTGQVAGERRSTKRGTSVEFADYRDYSRGDDLRRVDWNIYARLERPFVKLFEEEEDLAVHILLDGSGSMDWGENGNKETGGQGNQGTKGQGDKGRDENKWLYARRLAAALGYIALMAGDQLRAANLQSQIPAHKPQFGPVRGRGHTLRLLEWLDGLDAGGVTNLNETLRAYAVSGGRPGLVLLISDLFSPAGYVEGLTALAAQGHEVAVIHVLAPDEVEPPLGGDLRLVDVETGQAQEVTLDGGMRTLYRQRLAAWQDEIRATCRRRDVQYIPAVTDTPFDRVVLYDLRRSGVVR